MSKHIQQMRRPPPLAADHFWPEKKQENVGICGEFQILARQSTGIH